MTASRLRLRVLGSGAGGGLPQWNCGCPPCRAARAGDPRVLSRTQSSLAVSADGGARWVLLNASPDVRVQLASWAAAAPPEGALRASPIAATVLSNADLDHCLGLLILREGGAPHLYATAPTLEAIEVGLGVSTALAAYGPTKSTVLPTDASEVAIVDRAGADTGVRVAAFSVASKVPPYAAARGLGKGRGELDGDTVGLLVKSAAGGRVLAYVPGVRDLDERLAGYLSRADVIFIDGTFFTNDEMTSLGLTTRDARAMGHAPLSGEHGIVSFLGRFTAAERWLVHINNTNPIHFSDSPERAWVESRGVRVSYDGLELEV
ncbi:MAG: pyrroloquinoline quinone biosynthesis protein PqqB [Myxococcales bacterium]|nr:pyrroloquinoline quinone biosynthesis protein PqqB [Myxococcales bacterium]